MAKKSAVTSEPCGDTFHKLAHVIDVDELPKEQLDLLVTTTLGDIGKPKRWWDYGIELQINALLSGLGTPLANAASVVYKITTNPLLDAIEAMNPKSAKYFADVVSAMDNMRQGFGADLQYMRAGWTQGYPLDIVTSIRDAAAKLNISQSEAKEVLKDSIIAQRVRLAKEKGANESVEELTAAYKTHLKLSDKEVETFIHESYDYVRASIPGKGGEIIRWPTKLSVALDEYGKARFRRYKIGMMASEKARADVAKGKGDYKTLRDKYNKEALQHIVVDSKNNKFLPVEEVEAVKKNFAKIQADLNKTFNSKESKEFDASYQPYETVKEYALREMFQQKLVGMPKAVSDLKNKHPSLALFVPFLKTPWNITKEGFSYVPVVPQLMKKYIGTGDKNAVIPGAYYEITKEEMLARQAMGATSFAVIMGLVEQGRVTGKPQTAGEAQAWKDAGVPSSSIRIGDTWIAYDRIEPLATVIGLSAELARTWDDIGNLPEADQDYIRYGKEIGKGTMFALKSNIMQKSFMEGFSTFFNTVMDDRGGGLEQGVSGIVRQFTPALLNQIGRVVDPYERQATTITERIMQRLPLIRENLPQEFGLYGKGRETNIAQAMTSFNVQTAEDTPLQKYIYSLGIKKIREDKTLKGVKLNNDQLAKLRKMSNEYLSVRLNAFVVRPSFQRLPDPQKKIRLEKYIDKLKTIPRIRFYNELRRTDPEMAKKFKNEVLRKIGKLE